MQCGRDSKFDVLDGWRPIYEFFPGAMAVTGQRCVLQIGCTVGVNVRAVRFPTTWQGQTQNHIWKRRQTWSRHYDSGLMLTLDANFRIHKPGLVNVCTGDSGQ